jgi:sRNA-binding protein
METDEIAKDKQARYEAAFKVLNMLAETWPACFKHDDKTPVPLAIGTYHRVQAELGEMVDEEVLKLALTIYCRRPVYRAALRQPGAKRVDLDGSVVAPVTAEEQAMARPRRPKAKAAPPSKQEASATTTKKGKPHAAM